MMSSEQLERQTEQSRAEVETTINELRAIGGSGVVVTPVTYIFEEEPPRYTQLLKVLNDKA